MHFLGSAVPMDQPGDDTAEPPECAPDCPLCMPELFEPEELQRLQLHASRERPARWRR